MSFKCTFYDGHKIQAIVCLVPAKELVNNKLPVIAINAVNKIHICKINVKVR